ncbi:uncharacterized protein LOC111263224 [Varroa jacobsoni]|nr:uncharacterized protein LOC111263224 [Varroa jacobsoni]
MEEDETLSQMILSGSQDERPEIGYGGGDFVQKLLAKAQFREDGTAPQSPTPVKAASQTGLRRNRRTSKERELALLALRMPPRVNTRQQQQDAPSPGPVTRSRSSQCSSDVLSSPSNRSAANRGRDSSRSSLDDSTEALFGAIPPTPPLLNSCRTVKAFKGSCKLITSTQRKPENVASVVGASDQSGKQPRTPQNQRILPFTNGVSANKSSTPVSTPTVGGRLTLRGHSLLSRTSPMSSPSLTVSSAKANLRTRGRRRSMDLHDNGFSYSTSENISSLDRVGCPERRSPASLLLRNNVSVKTAGEGRFGDDSGEEVADSAEDSLDEDDFLSQVASQVEKKFMQQIQPTATRARSPRITSGVTGTRTLLQGSTLKLNKTRTPRKKLSKERESSASELFDKQNGQSDANVVSAVRGRSAKPAEVNKSVSDMGNGKNSQSSTSSGDLKRTYTVEEIQRKRDAAMRKRQQKQNAK